MDSPTETLGRIIAYEYLNLISVRLTPDFWFSELWDNSFVLSNYIRSDFYGSNRKPI